MQQNKVTSLFFLQENELEEVFVFRLQVDLFRFFSRSVSPGHVSKNGCKLGKPYPYQPETCYGIGVVVTLECRTETTRSSQLFVTVAINATRALIAMKYAR